MPVPATPIPWTGSLWWLGALALVAFLVSWVAADRMRTSRTPYIAVLTVVTAAISVGYVAWTGIGIGELLTTNWVWGLIVAPLAAVVFIVTIIRLPVVRKLTGRWLVIALLWEAVVYGTAEGVLLSALPVLMTWQMIHSLGWSGAAGALARWTLPLVASAVVIVVHHLGYWEYRNRLLVPITGLCDVLSLGYLVTASPIAPTLGHILGHAASLLHGTELPPHRYEAPAARQATPAPAGTGSTAP